MEHSEILDRLLARKVIDAIDLLFPQSLMSVLLSAMAESRS